MEFNISYTESTNIPEIKNEGNVYITNDTSQMYVDLNADLRIQIGDLYIVQSIPPSPLLLNKFYYNETNGYLYFYNGSWNKLNDINLSKEDINKILELEGGITLDQQLYLAIETTDSEELQRSHAQTGGFELHHEAHTLGRGFALTTVED